jgi:hypothetical protein
MARMEELLADTGVCVYRYWYSLVRKESVILSDLDSILIWIAICTTQCIGLYCVV